MEHVIRTLNPAMSGGRQTCLDPRLRGDTEFIFTMSSIHQIAPGAESRIGAAMTDVVTAPSPPLRHQKRQGTRQALPARSAPAPTAPNSTDIDRLRHGSLQSALSRRAKGFATSAIRWPHRSRNPLWASARRYSARQRHSSRSSRRASWSSLRWANRAFRVWSSASTTRRRVKSEGCDLTSGVAVASDMGGSSRAKVIGALNSRLGRADRSRFGGS